MGINDIIKIYNPCFSSWEFEVEAGETDAKNVWGRFHIKKVKMDEHYVLLGAREEYGKRNTPEIMGVVHEESEAHRRMFSICKEEAERMKEKYFRGENVRVNESVSLK